MLADVEHVLGAASTRWTDYLGTAAADDADALPGHRSIYELAGVDRDQWVIVAVDLFLGPRAQIAIYARVATAAVAGAGVTEVTQFRISDSDQVDAFLAGAFRTVAVRLTDKRSTDQQLVVTDVVAL